MGSKLNKVHLTICLINWFIWSIGVLITLLSNVVFQHSNNILFSVVHNYNSVVSIISLIPVEPIVFIITLRDNLKKQCSIKAIISTILLFVINVCLWLMFIFLFVELTGGV